MEYKSKNEVLPLGTVVLLKDATRYLVVIGYSIVEQGKDKVWDYLGCPYPVGVISTNSGLLFDKDQIEKIIYRGFSDEEGDKFRNQISISIGVDK